MRRPLRMDNVVLKMYMERITKYIVEIDNQL